MKTNLKTRIKDFWQKHKTKFMICGVMMEIPLLILVGNKLGNIVKVESQIAEQKMRDACAKVGITFEQFESILDAVDK